MSKAQLKRVRAGIHNFWQGGKSYEPYSRRFNRTLKRIIRERDNFTCRMCGKKEDKNAPDVHHIDYNKDNLEPNNLIALCKSCHIKTNCNREYWINYFKGRLLEIYK